MVVEFPAMIIFSQSVFLSVGQKLIFSFSCTVNMRVCILYKVCKRVRLFEIVDLNQVKFPRGETCEFCILPWKGNCAFWKGQLYCRCWWYGKRDGQRFSSLRQTRSFYLEGDLLSPYQASTVRIGSLCLHFPHNFVSLGSGSLPNTDAELTTRTSTTTTLLEETRVSELVL